MNPKKILIVEDEDTSRKILTLALEGKDVELIFAGDGVDAVEMAVKHAPDLIVMDIMLPRMNGLEATEKIRSLDKDIPIIALTAFAFADDREKSVEAGCTEHLAKPVKIEELKRVLQKYLG